MMTAVLVVLPMLTAGCFAKKLGNTYAAGLKHAYGRWMPRGGGAPMQQAAVQLAAMAPVMVQARQARQASVRAEDPPVRDEAPPQTDVQQPVRAEPPQVTYTRVDAPRYPSSPYIAMFPAAKGSSKYVCKTFQASADNKNDCMVECKSQMTFGPGSCSCEEMESCPSGVRAIN